MAGRRGRLPKRKLDESDTPSILEFVKRTKESTAETLVRKLLDDIITDSVFKAEKTLKKHGGDSVSEKTLESWKSQHPWLMIIGDGKDKKLKCKTCTELKVRSVWAEVGSTNIQLNSVKRHGDSNEHKKAESALVQPAFLTGRSIGESEDEGEQDMPVSSMDCNLFRTVFFAAQSEIPSSQINNLLQLQQINGASIEYQNLSWDTIREIQLCISKVFQKELVEDLTKSDVFAIMIDESTDLTVHKHLSICCRYAKDGEAVTKFLTNVDLEDGKAYTIVNKLISCFTALGLDAGKIVSLATDGASTMTGKKTGVGVQMKSKHSPFVVQTHCIAHRLNLAVCDSIKKEEILLKFREKFSELYHFMSGSSNRTVKLKKIQDILLEPSLTIKEPYSIRWLGLRNAVEAVYECYSSVIVTLAYFAAEKSASAKGLLKYFTQYKTVMLVAFMLDVHEALGFLSKEFQKEKVAFSEINPLIEATIGKLEFLETKDGDALRGMRNSIEIRSDDNVQAYLNGEKLTGYSERSESELLSLRSKYIASLKKNIRHRFRQEDGDIFKTLSVLLEPVVVNSSSENEHDEALNAVSKLYGEDKVVKVVHGNLDQDNLREEVTTVKKLLDKDKLLQEWPLVKGMIKGSYSKKSTEKLCKRILLLHGNALPEFSVLCKIALCMSVSSVACERSFSTQNRLKNKYRSSLKAENLDVLIQIQMSGKDLSNYDPSKAVRLWTTRKRRRKTRLTQQYKPRPKSATCLSSK